MLFIFFFHFKVYSQGIGGMIYNKLFLKISKFSFEFYMIHQFIISQCRVYLKFNEKILLIVTLFITIVISNIIKKMSIVIFNNKRKYNFRNVDGISIRGK